MSFDLAHLLRMSRAQDNSNRLHCQRTNYTLGGE